MRLASFAPDHPPASADARVTHGLFTQDGQTLVYGDSTGTVYIRAIGNVDILAEATTGVTQ